MEEISNANHVVVSGFMAFARYIRVENAHRRIREQYARGDISVDIMSAMLQDILL